MKYKLCFIGAGHMGGAMIRSVQRYGDFGANDIAVYDTDREKAASFGYPVPESVREAAENSERVILAIRPQDLDRFAIECGSAFKNTCIISMMAGSKIEKIKRLLMTDRVIRVMPNTSVQIGKGASCICYSEGASEEDREFAYSLFKLGGAVSVVSEEDINKVIPLTGSSPAYTYTYMRALCDGARELGLDVSDEELKELCCMAVIGAVMNYMGGSSSLDSLINAVKSPGGTTERACAVLDAEGFEKTLREAMKACYDRAEELSR